MTWLTWRQLRLPSTVVLAALAALSVTLAVTADGLHSRYASDVAGFIDQLQFRRLDGFLYLAGLVAVLSAPPVIAAFWGAPLIARELEAGTHRLVWNQSTTRNRWLGSKLAVTGSVAALAVGLLSAVVTWWSRPIDRAIAAGHGSGTFSLPRMDPVVFGARGCVGVGYVLFGLALGVAVGLVLRRSVAAVAVTLALVAAAEVLVPQLLRAHLTSAVSADVVISTENLRGIEIQGDPRQSPPGPVRLQVRAGGPADWGLANRTVDATGATAALPAWFGDCVSTRIGPPSPEGVTRTRAGGGRDDLQTCFTRLTEEGYRQHVTYQPARHFWTLQVRETALLLVLAGLLTGFCFWRINRDVS